ncbi:MAG: PD40 domain-containing protein [Chloroflexi bacterium]|nr:PD40 domain-containing protein [Chloroflexota bacterium]
MAFGTVLIAAVAVALGCAGLLQTITTNAVTPGPLDKVVIDPAEVVLIPEARVLFTAKALDRFGNVIPDVALIFWANERAGSIASSGDFISAKKAGKYARAVTVEATQGSSIKSAAADLTISPGPLHHVLVNPDKVELNIGGSQDFTATPVDAWDNPISGAQTTWDSDKDVGKLNNGRLTAGTKAGTFASGIRVTATQGLTSGTGAAAVTIKPGPLDSVAILPGEVQAGKSQQLKAAARDKYGNMLDDVQLIWTAKNGNVGFTNRTGMLTAGLVARTFPDSVEVTAKQGNIERIATGSVIVAPGPLEQLVIGPSRIGLGVEMTQQFVAAGADKYGNRIPGLSLTWGVESGGGTIDARGLFKASTTPRTYSEVVKVEAKQGDVVRSATANVMVEPDRIAFMSTRDSAKKELYLMDLDGSNVRRLTTMPNGSKQTVSWSPDGRRLAFDVQDPGKGTSQIIVVDDKGEQQSVISGVQLAGDPAWAPDGRRIAYAAIADRNVEIFVMDEDGRNVTRLTTNSSVDEYPSWSPDGTRIVFVSNRDGHSQIYVMNADGTGQRRLLTDAANDVLPSFSPDGTRVLFQTDATGVWSIFVMNADGTGVRGLTPNTFNANAPSWSPDGKKIVFHTFRDGNNIPHIYTMDPNGQDLVRVTQGSFSDYSPKWAPRKRGVEVNADLLTVPVAK